MNQRVEQIPKTAHKFASIAVLSFVFVEFCLWRYYFIEFLSHHTTLHFVPCSAASSHNYFDLNFSKLFWIKNEANPLFFNCFLVHFLLFQVFFQILKKKKIILLSEGNFFDESSDVTGLGRTRQKPDLDYIFQTETRLLRRNPEKPEPDCETRQNPKGFCKD